jgi:hypothetical protein
MSKDVSRFRFYHYPCRRYVHRKNRAFPSKRRCGSPLNQYLFDLAQRQSRRPRGARKALNPRATPVLTRTDGGKLTAGRTPWPNLERSYKNKQRFAKFSSLYDGSFGNRSQESSCMYEFKRSEAPPFEVT